MFQLDRDPPEPHLSNVFVASYHLEPRTEGEFTLFSTLPVEIRHKIWHHAISVPRILDMKKVPCWEHESLNTGKSYFADQWHYRIKNPAPLLSTCSESRQEALKAYQPPGNSSTPTSNPAWIRHDYDILHLKAERWDENGVRVQHMWGEYDTRPWSYPGRNISDGKLSLKRECFKKIEILAINREILFQTNEQVETVVREWFPSLKLLIILIDDEVDIEKAWDTTPPLFDSYERAPISQRFLPRWAFTSASTGPFTPVSSRNSGYKEYIEMKMQRAFGGEEDSSESSQASPYVVVMGCTLPDGLEIPSCGRWPA